MAAKKVAKKAKKQPAKKFWAVRVGGGIEIFKSPSRPTLTATEWDVTNAQGQHLYALTDLCNEVDPLFKDLKEGEAREVTVNLS